jgi:hypothetical protein
MMKGQHIDKRGQVLIMRDSSGKVGGLDRVAGWLALEGVYYASDSAPRIFYAGEELMWLEICDDAKPAILREIGF